MDKYTVDLDQVLNDFEYSELTDNNGRNQTVTNINFNKTTTTTVPPTTTTTTKHSINNVFHSLNEYLNSDIKTVDNIINIKKNEEIDEKQEEIEENPVNNETLCEIDENTNIAEEKTIEKVENKQEEIDEEQEEQQQQQQNDKVQKPEIEKETDKVDEDKNKETTDNIITNNKNDDDNSINDDKDEQDENLDKNPSINEDNSIKEDLHEETVIETKIDDNKQNLVEEITEKIEENTEITDNEIIEENDEQIENKIGFNDTLEIDESELNQYLEELEQEYESEQQQQQQEEEIKESQIQNEEIEKNPDRPKDLVLTTTTTTTENLENNDNKIDLVGSPGSTPFNNVYIDKELETKINDNDDSSSDSQDDDTTASISDSSTTEELQQQPQQQQHDNETKQQDDEDDETYHDAIDTQTTSTTTTEQESQQQHQQEEDRNDWLGNQAPLWIPDNVATNCLHCDLKFTVIKRRHHCRACGLVLCSKCCYLKLKLNYLDELARVCNKCYEILTKKQQTTPSTSQENSPKQQQQQPNPNNPLEYCSTIPPHQQVDNAINPTPSVLVPVGVLKRKNNTDNSDNNGNNRVRRNKNVMFCDGIRPGSDLTSLDNDFSYQQQQQQLEQQRLERPEIDKETKSFLTLTNPDKLPPIIKFTTNNKHDIVYNEFNIKNYDNDDIIDYLKNNQLIFALNINLFINLKILNLDCCINKYVWCFITNGLINVGQDEIVLLLELLDNEDFIPKDIFYYINNIYLNAIKGITIKEMDLGLNQQYDNKNFLGSKNHAGFLFIRPTFQCLQHIQDLLPDEPYLIGILIHRWETPWAKLFPLRLLLRLGAEYRYYPCPLISYRYRNSCFVEIGHTIINLLADFRNFSYTLPKINGLYIYMEEKITKILIPKNRYKQIIKTINNSSDYILAFGGNFSMLTDSHLVCIQDVQNNENLYTTHAINIHNKPRKLTGASFIVFNGALKSSSGLTAKSSIVEDGLMIQITPDHMVKIRDDLRNMKNHTIQCGCINSKTDEIVEIIWTEPDTSFNLNVKSPIDNHPLNGIPSIRVHNGKDYLNNNGQRLIRWTEVFIIKNSDSDYDYNNDINNIDNVRNDPVDISKISESIAKATCNALVKYLDLLISNNFYKIGIRTTLHVENVSYLAGSNNMKLPPIYMKSLDNELIPVLHRITSNNFNEHTIVLELFFRILNK